MVSACGATKSTLSITLRICGSVSLRDFARIFSNELSCSSGASMSAASTSSSSGSPAGPSVTAATSSSENGLGPPLPSVLFLLVLIFVLLRSPVAAVGTEVGQRVALLTDQNVFAALGLRDAQQLQLAHLEER